MSSPRAIAKAEKTDGSLQIKVGGVWHLTGELPNANEILSQSPTPSQVLVVPESLEQWDSSLPLFLMQLQSWCQQRRIQLDLEKLPTALKELFRLIRESEQRPPPPKPETPVSDVVATLARRAWQGAKGSLQFIGECTLGIFEAPAHPRRVRWRDLFTEMVAAGPKALPVIALLSLLIGFVFTYETATQLRSFGAESYVASALALAEVRQIGPMLAAVILAGRTGAAFAAHIGNMKLGGEIDALEMLGVSPITYLVLPRLVALFCMMPLIALYSDFFGMIGGLITANLKINMPPKEFWVLAQGAITMRDISVGLLKAAVFGAVIGLAGTLRGLQCERSSAGLGRAATSAVVTGISCIVGANALLGPVIDKLGF